MDYDYLNCPLCVRRHVTLELEPGLLLRWSQLSTSCTKPLESWRWREINLLASSQTNKSWLHQKINILEWSRPNSSQSVGWSEGSVAQKMPSVWQTWSTFGWANIAKSRCSVLIDFCPKRPSAGIQSKDALFWFKGGQKWAPGLCVFAHKRFQFFFQRNCLKMMLEIVLTQFSWSQITNNT